VSSAGTGLAQAGGVGNLGGSPRFEEKPEKGHKLMLIQCSWLTGLKRGSFKSYKKRFSPECI